MESLESNVLHSSHPYRITNSLKIFIGVSTESPLGQVSVEETQKMGPRERLLSSILTVVKTSAVIFQ